MNFFLLVVAAVICVSVQGFVISPRSMMSTRSLTLMMSDDESAAEPEMELEDKKMFDMNRRVRLGRSRDQDGKSNIWSIEPSMQVEEEEGEATSKNLIVGAAVIGAAVAALPLFNAFTSLFPDPADF